MKYILLIVFSLVAKFSLASDTLTVDQKELITNVVKAESPQAFSSTVSGENVILTLVYPDYMMTYFIVGVEIERLVEFSKVTKAITIYGSEYD